MADAALNYSALMSALNWAYDHAVQGIPKVRIDSAVDLAKSYSGPGTSADAAAQSLIRWQTAKAGAAGFVTGLGGVITMPVMVPANLASSLLIQLRMIAAVAHLGGRDVHDDRVRSMAFACLCGSAGADILKDVGVQLGIKLTKQAIAKISAETIKKINQQVGFRLLTKFGQTGLINLGKMLPVIGGMVGGGFDATATIAIGTVARRVFISDPATKIHAEANRSQQ
jgi:hypothetical protein